MKITITPSKGEPVVLEDIPDLGEMGLLDLKSGIIYLLEDTFGLRLCDHCDRWSEDDTYMTDHVCDECMDLIDSED